MFESKSELFLVFPEIWIAYLSFLIFIVYCSIWQQRWNSAYAGKAWWYLWLPDLKVFYVHVKLSSLSLVISLLEPLESERLQRLTAGLMECGGQKACHACFFPDVLWTCNCPGLDLWGMLSQTAGSDSCLKLGVFPCEASLHLDQLVI